MSIKKTSLSWLLCLTTIFSLFLCRPAMAEVSWPEAAPIQADGGILIDAESGAVLYEKNADQAYYPASITKILTALIIIENCDLDDMVTFSYNAVYNVEAGSSNMGVLDGDQLTVRDCLYGLMLASANEAANALAEHCAGSIEAFAEMMNEKAEELGCTGSHFANPSGLNDENHYTTARDMALITKAAIENPVFVEISSARYWKHAPIKRYPDPDDPSNTVYAHHAMLKKNDSRYYPGVFSGKTGYTSLAGNTLVTCARRDGMTLITVILNGHQTHYQDTKSLLDYGFGNFASIPLSEVNSSYASIEKDMTISGLTPSPVSALTVDSDCSITLPAGADFADTEINLQYDLGPGAPDDAAAMLTYTYGGHNAGSTYLRTTQAAQPADLPLAAASLAAAEPVGIPEPTTKAADSLPESVSESADGASLSSDNASQEEQRLSSSEESSSDAEPAPGFSIPSVFWIAAAVTLILAALITAAVMVKIHLEKKEERDRYQRMERRKKRLQEIGCSQEEFDRLMKERRDSHSS